MGTQETLLFPGVAKRGNLLFDHHTDARDAEANLVRDFYFLYRPLSITCTSHRTFTNGYVAGQSCSNMIHFSCLTLLSAQLEFHNST